MRRHVRLIVGIVVSLACLYYVVRGIDPAKLWEVFRGANYWFVLPAVTGIAVISLVRAARWRMLVYPNTEVPLGRLYSLVNIGYLFNNVLPAKVGEVVRGVLLGRMISGGFAQAVSSLLIERLLDVLALVGCVVIMIPFVQLPEWASRGGMLLGGVAIAGTLVLVLLARYGERGLEWVWRYVGRVPFVGRPRVRRILDAIIAGFRPLTVPRLIPGIVLWSVAIWGGYALLNYTMLAVFRMTSLPFSAAMFVLCATGFGMVVPSSPGAMGVFEGAAVVALSFFGVDQALGFAYAFGLHAVTNIALILLGLWGLRSESLTWSGVRAQVSGATSEDA